MTCQHRKAYRDLPTSPRYPVTRSQCVECGAILNPYAELSAADYHEFRTAKILPTRVLRAARKWEALKFG